MNPFRKLINEKFGRDITDIVQLKAHASERKIYRIFAGDFSVIGVHNDNIGENKAFINFSKSFRELGLNVPAIYGHSDDLLYYIEEDLGDTTLYKIPGSRKEKYSYYCFALSDLIRFQTEGKDKIDFSYCYQTRDFNQDVVNSDLDKFNKYFGKFANDKKLGDEMTEMAREICFNVLSEVDTGFFLYRDFQPRNIMLKDSCLYYIDYQSGRRGPLYYDVASFLYSGSIDIDRDEREELLNFYIDRLSTIIKVDAKEFRHFFYSFAFLRMLQVLGSYCYLVSERNDSEAAGKINKAIGNLQSITKLLKLEAFAKYVDRIKN